MADEIEEKGETGFDPAEAAKEYEAQSTGEAETEETEEELEGEGEEESDPLEEPEPKPEEEDDDEKFLQDNKGKHIPYSAFQKKYGKWKGKLTEREKELEKIRGEFEVYKKSSQVDPAKLETYRRLEVVFGNLDKAATQNPWLADTLMALGKGETPNWRGFEKALTDYTKTLPQGDPVILQQLADIQARQQAFEESQFSSRLSAHIASENEEIRKLLGDDKEAWKMLNTIASESVPEKGDISQLPNRVEIAKSIVAWASRKAQAELKTRIPKPAATRAGVRMPAKGQAGIAESSGEPPELGTEEYRLWAAGAL